MFIFMKRYNYHNTYHYLSWMTVMNIPPWTADPRPELAPRLARRLAQLPPQHVTALLAEGPKLGAVDVYQPTKTGIKLP
jgi:hypothetical protein